MKKKLIFLSLIALLCLQACGSGAEAPQPTPHEETNNGGDHTNHDATAQPEPAQAPDFDAFFNDFLSKASDANALKGMVKFPYVTAPSYDEATGQFGTARVAEADFNAEYFGLFTIGGEIQTGKFDEGGYLNGSIQDAFNELYGGLSNIYYAKHDADPMGFWAYFILENNEYKFIGSEEIESAM